MSEKDYFAEIRPYNEEEIPPAINRIASDKIFNQVIRWLFPNKSESEMINVVRSVSTSHDFQTRLMYPAMKSIFAKTSSGITSGGLENLFPEMSYLFISNHRDIALDSVILQVILYENGFPTTEISAGSNLLVSPLLVDIGKINKMFTVIREGDGRAFYENLKILSKYIRYVINQKKTSVWIAQRNGRTKNGDDRTEIALLKMLQSSYDGDLIQGFADLKVVPMSISYEYEPCDDLKTKEVYESIEGKYEKAPGEDLKSVVAGIMQPKGSIHIQFGNPLNFAPPKSDHSDNQNAMYRFLAEEIDYQIQSNYRLFPTNLMAHDLSSQKKNFTAHYSQETLDKFLNYIQGKISRLPGEKTLLHNVFLDLYKNPVENYIKRVGLSKTKNLIFDPE